MRKLIFANLLNVSSGELDSHNNIKTSPMVLYYVNCIPFWLIDACQDRMWLNNHF